MTHRANVRSANCDDAAGVARVHVDSWRTTYRDILPADFLATLSYQQRKRRWITSLCTEQSREFVYVAEDQAGQIVGFASGGPQANSDIDGYSGELYAIYLLETHQRGGLGRQLALAVAGQLAQLGFHSMIVWVAEGNPARAFYERLGGQPLGSKPIELGGTTINQFAYGWPDTASLLAGS